MMSPRLQVLDEMEAASGLGQLLELTAHAEAGRQLRRCGGPVLRPLWRPC
jgi:hypothetical protein